MSVTTSSVTPLIVQTSRSYQDDRNRTIVSNSYESVIHEPSSRIIRTYVKPQKPKYRYTIEQEGKTYRCCQWCRYWCTRKCPMCNCCDRIFACPLLFYILGGLFLISLFIALLTLFGLHPDINSARRYYGRISTLSIVNRTKYIYNLDRLCSRSSFINNCLDIVTSTGIVNVATTITINRTVINSNYSYIILTSCLLIYCIHRRVSFCAT